MKCMVCGKEYEGAGCPRCNFPNIQIPGDPDAAMNTLRPTIAKYRQDFLNKIEIGVLTYYWKDEDGILKVDHEKRCSFGTWEKLYEKEVWLPQKFARIPDEKSLAVKVYLRVGNEERVEIVEVPNLSEAQLQEIGVRLNADFTFCLMLRNDTGTPTRSGTIMLFQ